MRTTLAMLPLAALLATATAAQASTNLLAYESFSYGATANLHGANGGTGWSSAWSKLSSIPTGAVAGSLAWPDLDTAGGTAITAPYPSADFTRYSRVIAPYDAPDGVVYVSFLFMPNIGFGAGGGLSFGTWTNGMVVGVDPGTGFYGLSTPPGDVSADTATAMVEGETAFVVARIEDNGDGTFTWSIHVNPAASGPEPVTPGASMTSSLGLPQAVALYNDGGFLTDEIRVGLTWASVTSQAEPACTADLDGSGTVDGADLGSLLAAWGTGGTPADLDGSGVVDGADLGAMLAAWGSCG